MTSVFYYYFEKNFKQLSLHGLVSVLLIFQQLLVEVHVSWANRYAVMAGTVIPIHIGHCYVYQTHHVRSIAPVSLWAAVQCHFSEDVTAGRRATCSCSRCLITDDVEKVRWTCGARRWYIQCQLWPAEHRLLGRRCLHAYCSSWHIQTAPDKACCGLPVLVISRD